MPFVRMPGVTGKVYVPETIPGQTPKHPCPDCFACQQCSDDRCTVCRLEASVAYDRIKCRESGSNAARQGHHHGKQHQQKDKQAFK